MSIWRGTNALPSWSWRGCEGRPSGVEVYSDAAEIELLLNGVSQGRTKVGNDFCARFTVPYASGRLTAAAFDEAGEKLSESSLESASGKLSIRAKQEQQPVMGQPVYVDIDLVGENGIVESNADMTLTLYVKGAELLGFGSANPKTTERFDSGTYTTYYGHSQAVLLPTASHICLTVSTGGMVPTVLEMDVG